MQHSKLSDYKPNRYQQNLAYFDSWRLGHRKHQREAILNSAGIDLGTIGSPCGTGKTRIQIHKHVESMIDLMLKNSCGVHAIASPRLLLNTQLLDSLVDVAVRCGIPFDVLYVGSYKTDLARYYTKYFSLGYTPKISRHLVSTNKQEIENFILKSKELNRNVIIASTYHSFNLLDDCGELKLVTFDEAQHTLAEVFKSNIELVSPNVNRKYFYTATRKVRGDTGGMNDKDFYGELLYDGSPRRLMQDGEVACPKLHIISGEEDKTFQTSNTNMLVKNTIEAFVKHKELIKKYSASPNDVGAKLLISTNGIEELERIYNDTDFREFTKNMQCFAIDSKNGCFINWKKVSGKSEFLNRLNLLTDEEDAFIFNVNILTEGIDLPSITGVMPLRNLDKADLIQLNGRCVRLNKKDRASLYAGDIIPCNFKDYIKPYGYLIIPRHMATINEYQAMIDIIRHMMKVYESPAAELLIDSKFIDPNNEPLQSMIKKEFVGGSDYDLIHTEQDLVDEAELQEFKADLSALNEHQQKIYLQGMLA